MPRDGTEIGPSVPKVRRKRAISGSAPTPAPPASAPIGQASNGEAGGDGHRGCDAQVSSAISATVALLVSLQRQRQFTIVQKNRSERAIEALIASVMGFRVDATEKERKAVFAAAKAYRLAVEKGEGQTASDTHFLAALSAIIPLIMISASNREPWVELRTSVEKEMRNLTRSLPVHAFAQSVRGFGELGLACLVAEAGRPIGEYRTVSAVWMRMGVAVIAGERQQKCRDKAKAELHKYAPRRRSELWQICDSLFKSQIAGDKDEDGKNPTKSGKPVALPGHAVGPYGEVYLHRRCVTEPRVAATEDLPSTDRDKWTKMRCMNDARRIMSKALLRDLWRVWNGMPPRGHERAQDIKDAQDHEEALRRVASGEMSLLTDVELDVFLAAPNEVP